jgi:hypothetical protein
MAGRGKFVCINSSQFWRHVRGGWLAPYPGGSSLTELRDGDFDEEMITEKERKDADR